MSYRDALKHGQSNVGLGMAPCKPNCRCSDCTIDRLRARIAELEAERDSHQQWADYYRARWLGETAVRKPDLPRAALAGKQAQEGE